MAQVPCTQPNSGVQHYLSVWLMTICSLSAITSQMKSTVNKTAYDNSK